MREFIDAALNAAALAGASYADARIVETTQEGIAVADGRVEGIDSSTSMGIGVRVLFNGSWGFSSSANLTENDAAATARQAVSIARASALCPGPSPVVLAESRPITDSWSGPCEIDPFEVSISTKLSLLTEVDAILRAEPAVKLTKAQLGFYRVKKFFGSSEGSYITQEHVESGGGFTAYAITGDEVFPRSYPTSHTGDWVQGGWEAIERMDLSGNAGRIAEQAAALASAQPCPSGQYDVIIDGSQLALQVHESIGHPTELDRVLGDEAAFAGTSFLGLSDLGVLRYGSEHVNVTIDSTLPGALGSFGYDDEGVPAQRHHLITNGELTSFMTSRESAAALGTQSNGCMKADGWNRIPLIRMTTVSLEPGQWALDDLIASTDRGIYLETNNSWSIDDKRLNFQFACEIGWLIENGRLTKMVKNPNYTGVTPQFWNSCDAVCSTDHWRVWGIPNCGKGEPMQVAHVAHGSAPARFRDVTVGVGR
ncbi:MAG: TldD/PmbA family protein [Actinobacteria bacterium]|nr:TldD/PmbA family protein [Actinomycetota bacterium]